MKEPDPGNAGIGLFHKWRENAWYRPSQRAYVNPMCKALLAALLIPLAACAGPQSLPEPPPISANLPSNLPVDNLLRQQARLYVEALEQASVSSLNRDQVTYLQELMEAGCPEALFAFVRFIKSEGFDYGDQPRYMEALAAVGLDDPWFAPRFADFSRWARRDPKARRITGLHELQGDVADRYGAALLRLANSSSDPHSAAALRARFGILTITGHLSEPSQRDRVAQASQQLEQALTCSALAPDVRRDAQRLLRAANNARTGVLPTPVELLRQTAEKVTFPLTSDRPQLIILWGFT
ncbi:MAG: hypothetical protein ACI87O_001758 [Planctomycetota bacterium]|jgi:hypothetical protein